MVKAVGIVRFLSVVLFLAILGLSYAYLPVKAMLVPDDRSIQIDRGDFFYFSAGIFAVLNLLFAVISKSYWVRFKENPLLQAWLNALTPIVNIYLTLLVGFVAVLNNPTHVSTSSYGYLNFLGPLLLLAWIVGLAVIRFRKVTV